MSSPVTQSVLQARDIARRARQAMDNDPGTRGHAQLERLRRKAEELADHLETLGARAESAYYQTS